MIRVVAFLGLILGGSWLQATPAFADCSWSHSGIGVNGIIAVHASYTCSGSATSANHDGPTPPRDSDWDAVCVRAAIATGQPPADYCDEPLEPGAAAVPVVTPGLVAAALRRVSLPAAELVVQPPGGRTLVNFETNFYTEQGEFSRSVVLLGQRVELRIWPERFRWRFGDGAVEESASAGTAYPSLEVTHAYGVRGVVSPSVDVTYAAQFRVGGGAWQEVPGTVTVAGEPQSLRVVTARPVLVGD